MTKEHEVSAASEAFYVALNDMANGNSAAMGGIWAESPSATMMHPIGGREQGYGVIIGSFAKVAEIAGGGDMPRFVTLDAIPEISAWAEIRQCSI